MAVKAPISQQYGKIAIVAAACLAADASLVVCVAGDGQPQQEAIDMHLEDVGFVMRGASPQQLDRIRWSLPSHKFIARTANGRRYYLYIDPDLCKCVFLGDDAAMQSYKAVISPQVTGLPGITSADVAIEEMNQPTSDSISPGDILDY